MKTSSRRQFIVTTRHRRRRLCARRSAFPGPADAATLSVRPWGDELTHAGEINAWIVINPDDSVIIRYGRAEMGQGRSPRCRKFSPKSSNAIGPS